MNRTVRCVAIFAIGVGAWACKGDPQSSLDRGTISSVTATPASIFVDNGSTASVLVDARDQLNQAVEITGVSEAAGSGITVQRDYLYQPVFDASATDAASCGAIANASWTGAGCLVPRTKPTRLRYEITGTVASATSFSVTINGSNTLDIPVVVKPLLAPVTVTQGLPPGGIGLEVIRLTTISGFSFAPTALITGVAEAAGPIGFMNVGVDPAGSYIEYVQVGGTTGTPTVSGLVFIGIEFTLPANTTVTAAASTLAGAEDPNTAPAFALPGAGSSLVFWDDPIMSDGSIIGLPGDYYVVNGPATYDYTLTWDPNPIYVADLGTWFTDAAITTFECIADGFGGQEGGPESTTGCVNSGGQFMINATFDDVPPVVRHQFDVQ